MARGLVAAVCAVLVLGVYLSGQEPNAPPFPASQGRQYPYITVQTLQTTSVVTTVYTVTFLRVISDGQTNLMPMRTNASYSHVTNLPYSSPN